MNDIGFVGFAPTVTIQPAPNAEGDRKLEATIRARVLGETIEGVRVRGDVLIFDLSSGETLRIQADGGFRRVE